MSRVLVIDDDASLRFTLEAVLSDAGLVVEACDGGASGLAAFELHGADVVLTDLAMPEMDGMQVLARMRAADPSVPVMMLTAHGSERVAVAAMKAGAFDYIPKPFDPDELALAVRRATDWRDLRLQNARLRTEAALGRTIIAQSPAMTRVMDMVTRVAPKDVTVLLTGESGAGKDVLASVLQAHSRRADRALIRFNAAAIPAELAEAELFGHTRGAFTGAQTARLGYFQQAHKGTLFIDEIGDLPLAIQAKVLRAIQSGEVQQLGGRPETVDVRLIAATNRDLASDVKTGRFREDLYYRLNVVPIRVPSLRERPEDVEPLVRTFVRQYAERYGMVGVEVEPGLVEALRAHSWPGNVRELENTVARLLALAPEERITLALWRSLAEGPSPSSVPATAAGDPGPGHPLRGRVEAFERALIAEAFEAAGRNQSETARRLGVSRPALIEKLHKYGLIGR
ncbi:MAG TPA: sigma-54 dependent transcriptional regulator [Polyangiaceae bacterium]|jgi:two-component system response regulator AtoC|nr:sigma-54 dependent transcriptional regulator [Polyangiaceae bacterium]